MSSRASESTPLLAEQPSRQSPEQPPRPPDSPSWRDVAICALAYTTASLFVFTPLRKLLSNSSNKHIVATTSVYFHPVRSLGNLIEVIYFTLMLLLFAICVSFGVTGLVQFLYTHNLPSWAEDVVLLLFLGAALGFVGFMKVRANNPSFNTASSSAIIFLVTTLLKDDDVQRGAISFDRILHYLTMVALGAAISSTFSVLFYCRSSVTVFRLKADELMDRYADILDLLIHQFCSGAEDQAVAARCESTNNKANALLSDLKTQLQYASFEFAFMTWKPRSKTRYKLLRATLWSLQRQSMHLGGLLHCVGVTDLLLKQANLSMSKNLSRRHSSRWDSIGRSGIQADLKSSLHEQLSSGSFDQVFNRLTIPVQSFAKQLASFARNPNNTRTELALTHMNLARYTRERDIELRNAGELPHTDSSESPSTSAVDGLLATCSLFAHILQDLGEEILVAEGLRLDYEHPADIPTSILSPQVVAAEKEASFTQLTEALYPTRKAPHSGLGPTLWKLTRLFRNLDVQHGIRVGIGAIIISLPAFTSDYRDAFTRWHGEWALITYMIIMARNLGSMTNNIPLRIMGTSLGAFLGVSASLLCRENSLLLVASSAIVSALCFRRILSNNNPVVGRFVLLTYNLVCLYGYSISQNDRDDDEPDVLAPIYDIAFHRVIAVITGVLWAVFMIVTFWPHSARRALRSDLCIQWMRMGMTWKADPIGTVHERNEVYQARFRGIHNERELQNMMLDLEALLKTAPNEFRLRGKFDPEPYKHMLESTQVILDAFHSINILIKDEPFASNREQDLVAGTYEERQELCNLLFLQFYTASTSVRLGFPVPEYLPEPDNAIDRLVKKLRDERWALRNRGPDSINSSDYLSDGLSISNENNDFVLFHSYLMTTITISRELSNIHAALRALYGTLDDELLFSYV